MGADGPTIVLLWEDSLASGMRPSQFGPHAFLVACIADVLSRTERDWEARWYSVQRQISLRIESVACNGVDKLLERVPDPNLYRGGRRVVAIVDGDKIQDRLPARSPIAVQIRERAAQPALLHAHVLDRNLEHLLGRIKQCGGTIEDAELEAVVDKRGKGVLPRRDGLLHRHAGIDRRGVREAVCVEAGGWTGWPALVAELAAMVHDAE
jgi:hypothetical protein